MRISDKQIRKLQALLKDEFGLMYTDEEAQQAGLAIMRFVLAKERQINQPINLQEKKDDKN